MDTSNVSDEVSSHYAMNTAIYLNMHIEWTNHHSLGVGLGLVVRINNQYSHPVCMGRCMDTYATINDMWEISQKTCCLLSNIYAGIGEFVGMGYCVHDVQTMTPVESQLMTTWGSHTK